MPLSLASLNVRRLRDLCNCPRLLDKLSNLSVYLAAVQETQLICAVDTRVMEEDFVVLSALDSRCNVGILQIGRSLNADVDLIFAGDGDRLVIADVAVKIFTFRVVRVYVPNYIGERRSFFSVVGAVDRRFETDSSSGWLKCDTWSQDR